MTNIEMKSRVTILGNWLTGQGFSRPEAFVRAWRIVKAGSVTLPLKGVLIGNRQQALKRLSAYDPSLVRAFLVPEPLNPADKNAVAVMVGVQGGSGLYRLGYVPKEMTGTVKAMAPGRVSLKVVSGAWNHSGGDYCTFGARLNIAV